MHRIAAMCFAIGDPITASQRENMRLHSLSCDAQAVIASQMLKLGTNKLRRDEPALHALKHVNEPEDIPSWSSQLSSADRSC